MTKRLVLSMIMGLTYIVALAQEPYSYEYIGKDTLIDSTLYLHKGTVISINKPIQEQNSIDLYIDSLSPIVFKGNLNQLFKRVQSKENTDQGDTSECAQSQWLKEKWPWLAGAVLILLALASALAWYLLKNKRGNKKKPSSPKDLRDSFIQSNDAGDLPFLVDKSKKKNRGKHILQKIVLPKDETKALDYIEQISDYYSRKKDVADKLRKKYKNKESSTVTLKLPVFYRDKEPEEREKEQWLYLPKFKKWVKYIPIKSKDKIPEPTSNPWAGIKQDLGDLKAILSETPPTSQPMDGTPQSRLSEATRVLDGLVLNIHKIEEDFPYQIKAAAENSIADQITQGTIFTKEQLEDAINSEKGKWEQSLGPLRKQLKELDQWKDKYRKESEAKEIALNQIETQKATIQRMEEESKEYITRLLFYKSCQPFAKKAVAFLDTMTDLKMTCTKMYEEFIKSGEDGIDDLYYYMQRADNKLNTAIAQTKDYDELCSELRSLATTGLVTNGKMLHRLLSSASDDMKRQSLLQEKLYRDLFSFIGGAAVTMADEYAFVLPKYVSGADNATAKTIESISYKLQELLADMGYKLCYAQPLTPITNYVDVENCGSKDGSGLPRNTILEIKEMALLFGTVKKKTQVTIQQ